MALDVITFEKSLDDRLSEYLLILHNKDVPLPAQDVWKEWHSQIEVMVNCAGWQALWQVSRVMCEEFEIQFPTVIFVTVEEVYHNRLSALVEILAVQDDINLANKHEVPLLHLIPTVQQKDDDLPILDIAECLEQLRFFYTRIWQPWDAETNGKEDWINAHLKPRINLYKDMEAGLIDRKTANDIQMLLKKGMILRERIEAAEKHKYCDQSSMKTRVCLLMDLHSKLEEVKNKVEILENPLLRKFHTKKQYEVTSSKRNYTSLPCVFFIWLGGSCDGIIDSLQNTQKFLSPESFIVPSTFNRAIEEAAEGDTILLSSGTHRIRELESHKVLNNVTIQGIFQQGCVLSSAEQNLTLMESSGNSVLLRNITLKDDLVRVVIVVRQGTLRLQDCNVCGSQGDKEGILVLKGATVELVDCELSGFTTAIVAHFGATVNLASSKISSCGVGIQASEQSVVTVNNCTLNCTKSPFAIEMSTSGMQAKTDDMDFISSFSTFSINNTITEGDILILPKQIYTSSEFFEEEKCLSSEVVQ